VTKAFERGRRWGRGLVAVACAAGGVVARAAEQARPADAFVDSMGINIHAAFPWSSYAQNWDGVIDAVGDIGFRHVRDIPYNPGNLNALSAATGAQVTVIYQHWIDYAQFMNLQNFDAVWQTVKQLTHVEYFELPNEPETAEAQVLPWTIKLHETVRADPVLKDTPIIGTTSFGNQHLLVDTNPYLDYGNVHSYANGGVPMNRLDGNVARARIITGDKPIIATEAGYNNGYLNSTNIYAPGVTEAASAKYIPRLFLGYYNAGMIKTFTYELVDSFPDDTHTQQEGHFGLLRADFTYKPAATAVKNLIRLLEDPGPAFTASSLEYTITGGTPDLKHTLLQKRDGTFWLALWNDVLSYDPATRTDLAVAPLDVTLELGIPAVRATTYHPNLSQSPTGATFATTAIDLAVPDEVLLIALRLADPGDTDADGDVDNADFLTLYHHFGATGADWADGDFDRDGTVDFTDFQMLEAHFTGRLPPAEQAYYDALASSVPEPGAASLVLAVASLAFTRRRRAR
jgi:hypothetical protein